LARTNYKFIFLNVTSISTIHKSVNQLVMTGDVIVKLVILFNNFLATSYDSLLMNKCINPEIC